MGETLTVTLEVMAKRFTSVFDAIDKVSTRHNHVGGARSTGDPIQRIDYVNGYPFSTQLSPASPIHASEPLTSLTLLENSLFISITKLFTMSKLSIGLVISSRTHM